VNFPNMLSVLVVLGFTLAHASTATVTKNMKCVEGSAGGTQCADDTSTNCFKVLKPAKATWADCLTECEKSSTAGWCCHYFQGDDCTQFRGAAEVEPVPAAIPKDQMTAAVKKKATESSVSAGDAAVPASTEAKGFVCDDTGKDKPCADDAATDCFVDLMPKLTEKNWASCKAECEKVTTGPWCCHEFEGKMCTLIKGGTKTKPAPTSVKDKMSSSIKTSESQVAAPAESESCWGWQAVAFVAFASSLSTYTITKHMQGKRSAVSVSLLEGEDEL
jgi:hypothetical protein